MINYSKIKDICEITNGYAFKSDKYVTDEGVRVIRITNVQKGKVVDNDPKLYPFSELSNLDTYKIYEGDILMSLTGNVGRVGKFPMELLPAYINQRVCRVKSSSDNLLENYLFHFLNSDIFENDARRNSAGAAQLNLSTKWVCEYEIPLPPLPTQQKIASILDAADTLRQKDKALLAKYDELTQSLFLDMFGDPVRNEKGWKLIEGSKYYEVRGRVGWKGYKKTDLRQTGAIVLGATHINNLGIIDLSKVVYLSEEKYMESPEIMVQKFDLIFVQRGNTIGKIALVRSELGDVTINPVVLIFRPLNSNPYFLLYLLMNKGLNREFVASNSGSAQPMITQKTMKEYLMIDVPLSLQNHFAERVAIIEQQKELAQASLEKSEQLFNSLLQKAFKGELV
jgi:type I restriction enzyme S subunit